MVRHWSADGGFGFLNDGQSEYFCHGSQLKNCYSLEVGDKVTFTAAPSKKKAGKKEAKEVYLVDGQGAAARMMGRGGFGSSTAIEARGRAEPSISSIVPIIESQKDASKAAPPHRQAVGLSKGVPSQLRQTSKADQSIGQSTAASSSTARATASAAALSQHGSAVLNHMCQFPIDLASSLTALKSYGMQKDVASNQVFWGSALLEISPPFYPHRGQTTRIDLNQDASCWV